MNSSKLSSTERDEIIRAAVGGMDANARVEFEGEAEYLAGRISSLPGGRGFGKTRARELIASLACFLNSKDV